MATRTPIMALRNLAIALSLAVVLSFSACNGPAKAPKVPFKVVHPEWSLNATIYEVNVRQFTPEGTFKAFETHLPRLKELGVDILWFMPIHPIGVVNRKGSLGSYYSVRDYLGVNPEYGTLDDFKQVVGKAHELGMYVLIDWVANHTSHDAVLVEQHPDWYVRDSVGKLVSPFDWTDVAKLDYSKPELREYIINAMKYWVSGVGVDGFRCDVAAEVPADFWNAAREEIVKVKPVVLLAEGEKPELLEYAFDADYGWEFHHLMNGIAQGKKTVLDLEHYLLKSVTTYPKNTIKMNFITNHDENSWNGTEFERMGDAVKTMAALSYLVNGMPLIYSGQEVGFNRRLPFFEKDQITWDDPTGMTAFYQKLNLLKGQSAVLSAGERGADIFRVKSSNDVNVLAFVRENETEKLFAVFNLSPLEQVITLEGDTYTGVYENYMKGDKKTFNLGDTIKLNPWEFSIYKKK